MMGHFFSLLFEIVDVSGWHSIMIPPSTQIVVSLLFDVHPLLIMINYTTFHTQISRLILLTCLLRMSRMSAHLHHS
jgi:hypothetical protein